MRLLFKQRLFSWFCSYDIFDEQGQTVYTVKGQLSWGHCLKIFDTQGQELGTVKQRILTWMPKFDLYLKEEYWGCISREFTFFKPKYHIDCNGWNVDGDWTEWNYQVLDSACNPVATVSKEIWKLTDTYIIDVHSPRDALCALMLVLAIDAEKCSRDH